MYEIAELIRFSARKLTDSAKNSLFTYIQYRLDIMTQNSSAITKKVR